MKAVPTGAGARWSQTFAALRYPNYRLWFLGQLVSLFGTWMQMTAQGYLVYELTHSPAYLGYVAFASGVPTWLFTLYGGVIADRMSRRKLMVITQMTLMVLAFVLAALTFKGVVHPLHIVGLAFLSGIALAFDAPARQAFVPEMVERRDLTNAIALNATMFHSATAAGPAVAGFAYAAFGPGWCFFFNGVSFLAAIAALLAMRLRPPTSRDRRGSTSADLREGLTYIAGHSVIRAIITVVGMMSLFGIGVFALMPAWAVDVLGGDATTLGFLMSARGVGAVAGALILASISSYRFKGRVLTAGTIAFPILLFLFALVRWLPLSLLVLVGAGAALIFVLNLANAIVQSQVSDSLRGRVMGLYALVFLGSMPVGGLLAGAAAHHLGEPPVVALASGALLACAGGVWLLQPGVRRVDIE